VAAIFSSGLAAAKEMLRTALFESALEERGSSLFETTANRLAGIFAGRGQTPANTDLSPRGTDHHKTFKWKSGSTVFMASAREQKKEAEHAQPARTGALGASRGEKLTRNV